MTRKWTEKDIDYLKDNYGKNSLVEISRNLKRTYVATRAKALRLNLRRRYVTNVNMEFFSKWSPELAYIVGFFLADGDITNPSRSKRYAVRISSTDSDIIEKIVKVSGYTGKISKSRQDGVKKISYRFNFSGYRIWKIFNSFGFDNRKSYTAKFPEHIPQHLIHHFIRGVFDGDGSIRLKHTMYPTVDIVGTRDVVCEVGGIFSDYNEMFLCKNTINTWRIAYHGENAINVLNCIYRDSTIHMNRKYVSYLKALKWKRQRRRWFGFETKFICNNYQKMPVEVIANYLRCTPSVVYSKANQLGLKKFIRRHS